MDLRFSDAEELFRAEFQQWLEENIPTSWRARGFWRSLEPKRAFEMRREWETKKAVAGYAGIQWPTEYGGRGGTPGMRAIYDVEMVRYRAPNTVNTLGLSFLGPTIMALGTEQQKKDVIRPLLFNEVIWCQGFSEPNAGSDLAGLQLKAKLDGDYYVLNGQKIWTSYAMHADKMFGLVRTSKEESRHRGITFLLIDLKKPDGTYADGIEVRPLKQMSGALDFGEVFFTDAHIPAANVVGEPGNGWQVAMFLLSFERGASALPQYQTFRRELDEIIDLARGMDRLEDPEIRDRIGRNVIELECLRLHCLHQLTENERGQNLGMNSSVTKLQWSETHQDVGELFTDVAGLHHQIAAGIDETRDLLGSFMSSRSETIWGGSSQIQRNIVAEQLLGLPK
jgi:alkylation response protein AidB-like acyl-CoA dehydrogenase